MLMKVTFEVRNTEKAARFAAKHTGRILVRFPFNDYYRGPGRVFTGSPKAFRKPIYRAGSVFVKYDSREFKVVADAVRFTASVGEYLRGADGRYYAAHLSFRTS